MLKKYLPDGLLWDNKFIQTSNIYKLIKAIDDYFNIVKLYIVDKYKILSNSNIMNWNQWLLLPDYVFKTQYKSETNKYWLIKLNRKDNSINGILEFCKKLDIDIEIIQNNNLLFSCKIKSKKDIFTEDANFLESDLEINLTGNSADYNQYLIGLLERYLEKITIATCEIQVELME